MRANEILAVVHALFNVHYRTCLGPVSRHGARLGRLLVAHLEQIGDGDTAFSGLLAEGLASCGLASRGSI
jgi:hypothetical protein